MLGPLDSVNRSANHPEFLLREEGIAQPVSRGVRVPMGVLDLHYGYWFVLCAVPPLAYYCLAVISSRKFFQPGSTWSEQAFLPPVSVLKPVRGTDPDAYTNFASFCVQDYPDYEIVFCIDSPQDPTYQVLLRLMRDFQDTQIRVLFGSGSVAPNDKVAKLARLTAEARHDVLVINDSDVRVRPDYLRTLVRPLADPAVGAVTCFYLQSGDASFTESLQTIGMVSEFYPGILTDWNLEGVKFTLGPTIATTRARLEDFGGYKSIDNRPADDLLVGQLIAQQGYKVELLPYCIEVVADYGSFGDLLQKRLRWLVEMRHIRPWGHFGLLFTQGLLGLALAIFLTHSAAFAASYFAAYLALRLAMTWVTGIHGLGRADLPRKLWIIPVWDAIALGLWLASFSGQSFRWRGARYRIQKGMLIPVMPEIKIPTAVEGVIIGEATGSAE
jgi:ceramide glucosyltransferase